MKKTLIVIDMQNDFVTGVLGTPEAAAILPKVKAKIQAARAAGQEILFTRDTHGENYAETQEGKRLPVPHCIRGTHGWELVPGLWEEGERIIDKPSFGYTGWGKLALEEVELIGVCTDLWVVSNALLLKAAFPEIRVGVDAACCAGVTPEAHRAALAVMKSCQVEVTGE